MKSGEAGSLNFIRKKYYLPIISALLLAVSVVPYYLLITNFIFLIPLLFFIKDEKSGKEALKGGILFGSFFYITILYWFYGLFKVSFVLASVLCILLILFFTVPFILLVVIASFLYNRLRIRFFLFMPFLWIFFEHIRTFGPFRFTGDHISNSLAIFPQLIQFTDCVGPYGIAFWIILVNCLLFEVLAAYKEKRAWIKHVAAAVIIFFLPISYSLYQWNALAIRSDLKVSMIQPNIPLMKKLQRDYEKENMDTILSLTEKAIRQDPDIIIWPETSFLYMLEDQTTKEKESSLPEVYDLALSSSTPILIGAEYVKIKTKQEYDIYNAAFLIDSRGSIRDYYAKLYLVPFTEGIPFNEFFGFKRMGKKGLFARLGGFTPGARHTVFSFDRKASGEQSKFGVLICYEGLYPELSRQLRKNGADFLVCITNDAWFGDTWFPHWHASALRMRAIENRASIARCANTGVSCFFDPLGRMYQKTEIFTEATITGFLSTQFPPTFYARNGDIILYIAYPIVLLLLFIAVLSRKKL